MMMTAEAKTPAKARTGKPQELASCGTVNYSFSQRRHQSVFRISLITHR
jgi:hypothetical protein